MGLKQTIKYLHVGAQISNSCSTVKLTVWLWAIHSYPSEPHMAVLRLLPDVYRYMVTCPESLK